MTKSQRKKTRDHTLGSSWISRIDTLVPGMKLLWVNPDGTLALKVTRKRKPLMEKKNER
jgi:hypothetical protein